MSRWEQTWDEDAGPLVRPFALTGGRTQPGDDFTLITLVTTVDPDLDTVGLQPEHVSILRRCRHPLAVAEIAAYLDLPVSIVKILLGDLLKLGRITARPPIQVAQAHDIDLLRKVRDGLRRL